MNDWRDPVENPVTQREQDMLDNYGYDHDGPGLPSAGGLLGWLGRSMQRNATRRANRWAYWNVPGLRSWLRFRRAGPLGRVGCVIQLLIQVAVLTVMVLVGLQLADGSVIMQGLLAQLQGLLP